MPSDENDTSYSLFGDDSTGDGNDGENDDGHRDGTDRSADGDDGPGPGRAEYDGTAWSTGSRADADAETLGSDGDAGCPKCGGEETETDEIATSGTGLTKLFDVQNRRFVVVSCANCGYSELYKGQSTGDAIDFFIG
ncbi:zinc ribbon domain-containing protein [Halorubrum sp. F4]|uniref:zinc ribbon domain-containing protein n=1 Tax=Halorubrum sp. F4 TaxID=2989715 RepID=UPI00248109F1|nr:zinc ribbon domain-containing protein [Halorubrum sp. F4]